MWTCSNRDKPHEKLIVDLQTIVAQMRMEVHRSNQSISELQSALQKSNMRIAEVEVSLENSKEHIVRVEAANFKSNQHIIDVEEQLREGTRPQGYFAPQPAGDLGLQGSPREDGTPNGGLTSINDIPTQQKLSDPATPMDMDRSLAMMNSSQGGQGPALETSSFIKAKPLQERVSSLEVLVSNLWQFHVSSLWLPAPQRKGLVDDKSEAFAFSRHLSSLRDELVGRINRVEQAFPDFKVEIERSMKGSIMGGNGDNGLRGGDGLPATFTLSENGLRGPGGLVSITEV